MYAKLLLNIKIIGILDRAILLELSHITFKFLNEKNARRRR